MKARHPSPQKVSNPPPQPPCKESAAHRRMSPPPPFENSIFLNLTDSYERTLPSFQTKGPLASLLFFFKFVRPSPPNPPTPPPTRSPLAIGVFYVFPLDQSLFPHTPRLSSPPRSSLDVPAVRKALTGPIPFSPTLESFFLATPAARTRLNRRFLPCISFLVSSPGVSSAAYLSPPPFGGPKHVELLVVYEITGT